VHRNKFICNKTNRRTNFPDLFCQENRHVSGSSSAHHQKFSTVLSALVYVMPVCHQTSMTYTSAECTVENSWWWTKGLPETCRFSWQNKSEKLVRLLVLLQRNLSLNIQCITLKFSGDVNWWNKLYLTFFDKDHEWGTDLYIGKIFGEIFSRYNKTIYAKFWVQID